MSESPNIERRSFLRSAGLGALGAAGLAAGIGVGAPGVAGAATAAPGRLVDAGAGLHATMSTAGLMAAATISRESATCGVGTPALETALLQTLPGVGPILGGLPILGDGVAPFAMMMYSYSVTSYDIDRQAGTLRAAGQMRSITEIAGVTIEDVEHPYIFVGKDARGTGRDSVALSFTTPFWAVGTNPLASPSDQVDGWSMFGGPLMLGEVNVAS